MKILKRDGDRQIVTGAVLVPDEPDLQGDILDAREIEDAAHNYLRDYRAIGLQHARKINDRASVIESWIAPSDVRIGGETVKAGSWILSVKIDDPELWSLVKSGALRGFSIGGYARREPIDENGR